MQAFPLALETRPWPAPTLLLTGAVACVADVVAHGAWRARLAARRGKSLILAAAPALPALPLHALRRWASDHALACASVFALIVMTDVPVLAVGLPAAGACALGRRIVGAIRAVSALPRSFPTARVIHGRLSLRAAFGPLSGSDDVVPGDAPVGVAQRWYPPETAR